MLASPSIQAAFRYKASTTTNISNISTGKLAETLLAIPPLPEQEWIVARLEELLSDLEAGVRSLERVWAGVKRYKASVLKAACEGKLFESRGVETSENGLPEGWKIAKIGSIFNVKIGSTPSRSKPEYWNGNIHWVSSGEVRNLRIKTTRELITDKGLGSRTKLCPPGTVLLAMIGEGKTRGQTAILDIEAATNQNIAAILPNETETVPEWVFYWLISRYEETRKSGVGGMQYALNSERVRNFDIPLPPLEEQRRIVAEVERRLESARAVEAAAEAGLKRAARLRQSMLKKAFEGKLS
jgi:type I restriction enzyme S subunit